MYVSLFFFRGQRQPVVAQAKVVVVRADGNPRLGSARRRSGRGQIGGDVPPGTRLAHHVGVHPHLRPREREAGDVRVAGIERLLRVLQVLVGHGGEQLVRQIAGDAEREDARPGDRRVERHRNQLPGVRRARSGHDQHRLRAVLTGCHRLVSQIGIAGEDALGLAVGVFGEVPQDEHNLVFDVEASVAVVPEVLAVGHDDAVAGKDDRALDIAIVGEGKRPRAGARALTRYEAAGDAISRRKRDADAHLRSAVARAGGELERRLESVASRERPRADALQLRDDELAGEGFALRPGHAAAESFRRQRLYGGTQPRSVGGGMADRRGRQCERQQERTVSHGLVPDRLSGAWAMASSAFS